MAHEIRSEFGLLVHYQPRSYDMACRVAHYLREAGNIDFMVCDTGTGRAMSEVVDGHSRKDNYAKGVAQRLLCTG
jgi:hypothetical protein